MKLEAVPFFGILVALVVGLSWFLVRYEFYRFREVEQKQFCSPAITEGTQRLGRDVTWLREEQLSRGDLVRFKTARTGGDATSRIVAVAGQTVSWNGPKVVIDGEELNDPWARRSNGAEWAPPVLVPDGCIYVLNDLRHGNGSDRLDSRALGPIPVRAVEYVFPPKAEKQAAP
jgi:signal peptidase I